MTKDEEEGLRKKMMNDEKSNNLRESIQKKPCASIDLTGALLGQMTSSIRSSKG